jgi:hypothetical protein
MFTQQQLETLRSQRKGPKKDLEERDKYIGEANDRANFFKMMKTNVVSFDENYRMRNWNNLPKEVVMRKKAKGFYGGAYRTVEYEYLGDSKVSVLCIYLEKVEPRIGDDIAQIEGDKLRVKKYSGEMPSEVIYYDIVNVEGVVIAPTRKRICSKCQKIYNKDSLFHERLGFCSEKCHAKHIESTNKKNMKVAVTKGKKRVRGYDKYL